MANMLFFMTYGQSLSNWQALGVLSREVAPLIFLTKKFKNKLTIVSFGEQNTETKILEQLNLDINLICVSRKINFKLLFFHAFIDFCKIYINLRTLRFELVLTNQLFGGWNIYFLKMLLRAKLGKIIVRSGFDPYHNRRIDGSSFLMKLFFYCNNKLAFKAGDTLIFTTPHLQDFSKIYGKFIEKKKKIVCYNWIDEKLFYDYGDFDKRSKRIITVARLVKPKKIDRLLIFAKNVGLGLTIVGDGPEKENLENLAKKIGCEVVFRGKLNASKIAKLLNEHMFFATFSSFEGSPKAVIEAICCGCYCVLPENQEFKTFKHLDGCLISDRNLDPSSELKLFNNFIKNINAEKVRLQASNFKYKYSSQSYAETIQSLIVDKRSSVLSEGR